MKKYDIAGTLKHLRKTSGISAKEAARQLENHGIHVNFNTVYGYESGLSMPNADTFIALCLVYGCKNPMALLNEMPVPPVSTPTLDEQIERLLDTLTPAQTEILCTLARRMLKPFEEKASLSEKDNK